MPGKWTIRDNESGNLLTIESDRQPTQAEAQEIFAQQTRTATAPAPESKPDIQEGLAAPEKYYVPPPLSETADVPMFNLVNPLTPKERESMARDHPKLLGVYDSLEHTANALTTPRNLFLLAAGLGVGILGPLAARGVALTFAGMTAKTVPKIGRELAKEYSKPESERNKTRIAELITDASTAIGFTGLLAGGAIGKPIAEKLGAYPAKELAPATAQALKEQGVKSGPVTAKEMEEFQQSARAEIEKGAPDAGSIEKTAEVHGAVRTPAVQSAQKVPAQVSGEGVQPGPDETPAAAPLTPAIKVGERIVTGEDHVRAYEQAKASGTPDTSGAQEGFVTKEGKFLSREEAAKISGLPTETEPGKLHSSDLPESKTPAPAPRPEEPVNDWTSATQPLEGLAKGTEPQAKTPEIIEKHAGIPIPGVGNVFAKGLGWAKNVLREIRSLPEWSDFKESLLNWSAMYQRSHQEIYRANRELKKAVPDKLKRKGITNWIQAKSNTSELQYRASLSKPEHKPGYEAALKLTPEEIQTARKVGQTYDILLKRAQKYDVLDKGREDYVTQIWEQPKGFWSNLLPGRKLSRTFQYGKERFFENYFEGEQAGMNPKDKDIASVLPIYMQHLNKVIADRMFVERLSQGAASDGRPLVSPTGRGKTIDKPDGSKAYLVFPRSLAEGLEDYKTMDGQPALHKWKWATRDEKGNPIFYEGDLAVHPEIFSHLRNVLGRSELRRWWETPGGPLSSTVKGGTRFLLDVAQPLAKEVMLGAGSPFHIIQEGTHGVFHRVNPFAVSEVDLNKFPEQMDAAQHGLMLAPDRASMEDFSHGLGGTRFIGKLPGKAGPAIDAWNHFTFEKYIPGLKWDTYRKMLERNTDRYKDQLALGEVNIHQIKNLSARQANAAYGHLNYAELGRNPTLQHFLRVFGLAPDFFEARSRFAGQAGKGFVTAAGWEQLQALAFGAGLFWTASRIINKLANDDWMFDHPFSFVINNREYRLRSVPDDLYRITSETVNDNPFNPLKWKFPEKFMSGRLSPLVGRTGLEIITGRNYRGEKMQVNEALEDALLTSFVPIWAQHLPGIRELSRTTANNPVSPWESFLSASGLHVNRYSPITITYQNAHKWLEAQGKPMERGTYPVSKYQQLRYALEDGDYERARDEAAKLIDQKSSLSKIKAGFQQSLGHPFTDTSSNDRKFRQSLSERDKAIYDAALQRRRLIWQRFMKALEEPLPEKKEPVNLLTPPLK